MLFTVVFEPHDSLVQNLVAVFVWNLVFLKKKSKFTKYLD